MTEHERLVEDMAMLIRRMARRLEKHGEPLATVARQFLAERGLESSVLRHCDYVYCSLPHGHIQSCNNLDAPITERKKA